MNMLTGRRIFHNTGERLNGNILVQEAIQARPLPALTIGTVFLEQWTSLIPGLVVLGTVLAEMGRRQLPSAPLQ